VISGYKDDKSEFDLAYSLAEKKIIQLQKRNIDTNKYQQKISSFLISRGFDFDTCREVCEKILKQDPN